MVAPAPSLVSFVIPVKDEEDSLQELFMRIAAVMNDLQRPFEIIFIDDGSVDKSWAVINDLAKANPDNVLACKFRKNSGKADALAVGFQAARGDIVFTLDADLQDDPKEIPRFIEKLEEGFDLVSGWKKTRHDPWHKVLPSRVFNRMISRVVGVKLHDHNCGFKCYRAEVIKKVSLYGEMHRMIPSLASIEGYRSTEIEVEHHARKFGQSKYGLKRFFRGFMDMQTVYFLKNYRERPLHFFGGQAAICLLLGLFLAAVSFLPWPGLVIGSRIFSTGQAFLILSGPLLAIGFLAEMLLRSHVVKERRAPISEVIQAPSFLAGRDNFGLPERPFARTPELPEASAGSLENILVVDDDAVTRRILRLHLEDAGYNVDEAADGEEAQAKVSDSTAVVLLDLNLAGHNDGLEILRHMRKRHAEVKVVMVSGQDEVDTAVQTMKLGAFDYLIKPAQPEQVLKTIRKAIHVREMAAE
jgi:glycosyltransferase involved in cell wall biosynthesis/CheY-like chemotaxis protein